MATLDISIGIILSLYVMLYEGLVVARVPYSVSLGPFDSQGSFGSCDRIRGSQLGNNRRSSYTGLVSLALQQWFLLGPRVRIKSYKFLCMGESSVRSKFTSASVVVHYNCQGESCPGSRKGKPLHIRPIWPNLQYTLKCGYNNSNGV